ncbi:hypothetical protein NGM36_18085 [Streptomyces mutabilis]|nr:hypothetical protein [Streptomyces mutabilis]MCZ9351669.1 hypothetical protein [Streptomyces mutabilis]
MSKLLVGGPTAVNACGNATVPALVGNKPVMLVHAYNGGNLRPADLNEDSHDKAVHLATTLDQATKDAQGHPWHITPAGFFGQRPAHLIESATGTGTIQTGSPDSGSAAGEPRRPPRRRITVHQDAPRPTPCGSVSPTRSATNGRGKNSAPEDHPAVDRHGDTVSAPGCEVDVLRARM